LDPQHGDGMLHLESSTVAGRKVVSLQPTSPLAFAIEDDRLILGSTASAVAHALNLSSSSAEGAAGFEQLRAEHFPDARSFLCVDLVRLDRSVESRRAALAARLAARQRCSIENAERDLDQAIALMALFRQAYLTATIEPDATAVHRVLGLIA